MLEDKGFDLWADSYDKSVGLSDESNRYPFAGYKQVLNAIYRKVLSTPKPLVLDIGFGTAALTTKLYEQGCAIWGLDFSQRMIELASPKMPNAKLLQGDFTQGLPDVLQRQVYDYVVATYSLHHLTDEQKVCFIQSILPLLKEKGQLLIGDVAFETRSSLEACRKACGEDWDAEEVYFVCDELATALKRSIDFQQFSFCAGVLTIEK